MAFGAGVTGTGAAGVDGIGAGVTEAGAAATDLGSESERDGGRGLALARIASSAHARWAREVEGGIGAKQLKTVLKTA